MNESNPHAKSPTSLSWMIWPGIVVALLAGQLIVSFVAAALALGDPAQVVEPDYYGKALRWEQSQAELRQSEELGWVVGWEIADAADLLGQREVKLVLIDAEGEPVTDAVAGVLFYHHALSGQREEASLTHSEDGVYTAVLPMRRDGTWQMNLRVTRGEVTFVNQRVVNVGESRKSAR